MRCHILFNTDTLRRRSAASQRRPLCGGEGVGGCEGVGGGGGDDGDDGGDGDMVSVVLMAEDCN